MILKHKFPAKIIPAGITATFRWIDKVYDLLDIYSFDTLQIPNGNVQVYVSYRIGGSSYLETLSNHKDALDFIHECIASMEIYSLKDIKKEFV